MKPNFLDPYAKPFIILLFGFIFFIAYTFLIWLTFEYTQFYNGSFNDFIFNVHLLYTPEQLYKSLNKLNPELIRSYPIIALLDVFIAILYGVFGSLLSFYIISSVTQKTYYLAFSYLFLIASIVNMCEDLLLSTIFLKFPEQMPLCVLFASILTLSKYLLLGIGILFSLTCLIIFKQPKIS